MLTLFDGQQPMSRWGLGHACWRDLSYKIMLVCCGKMGCTLKLNDRGGRDHWERLLPLMISGIGLS